MRCCQHRPPQSMWTSRRPGVKVVFNAVPEIRSRFVLGSFLYQALGGGLPGVSRAECRSSICRCSRDLGLFFVFGATYFAVNTIAVNAAVAISSGRRFGEVWNPECEGAYLGYDLGASAIALVVAFFYRKAEHLLGFGPLGLIGVIDSCNCYPSHLRTV